MVTKIDQWKAIVKESRESGLSQHQFCIKNGIKVSTFRYWVHRVDQDRMHVRAAIRKDCDQDRMHVRAAIRKDCDQAQASGSGLVRVSVPAVPVSQDIVIEVAGRYRVVIPEGASTEHMRRVLEALR